MASSLPLPRLFGPYVLTKALSADVLGETYRAGTAAGTNLAPFLLIRVFAGAAIDRGALLPAMEAASEVLEEVRGPATAKGMVLGTVDDVPFAGIEYVPGRTLDLILKGGAQGPSAFPIEHALLIGEKLLVALEAAKPLAKRTGAPHGFLVPAFVTVSNDGDVRVFGAGLGSGLMPSLKDEGARRAFAGFIAPEVAATGTPSLAGDVFSASAILLACLTGKTPAAGAGDAALASATLAVDGNPVPDDVKAFLARGLARDPARREGDVTALKKGLSKLLYGGPYAPSTFNLAFFMHRQHEREIEAERREMTSEEAIDARALEAREAAAAARPAAPARTVVAPRVPSFGVKVDTRSGHTLPGVSAPKSGLGGVPVALVAGIVAVLGAGGFFLVKSGAFGGAKRTPTPIPLTALPTPVPTPTYAPPPTPVIVGKEDPEFQKALAAKLAEEEKKITDRIARDAEANARRQQAEQEKIAEAARKTKEAEDAARAARDRADQEEATRLAKEAAEARQREEAARAAAAEAARAAASKAASAVKEGDLVDIGQVDTPPRPLRLVKPEMTRMAIQRGVKGSVLLSVLVGETGRAEKIEVVRDTSPRAGLAEACQVAVKQWEFTPATKDGKKVKAWLPVNIPFK